MEKRKFGKSNVSGSVIGLGTFAMGGGQWWGEFDEGLAEETIVEMRDAGINTLDTAPIYGLGRSEEIVGRALKRMNREDVVICTKCGNWWHDVRGSRRKVDMYGVPIYKALDRSTIREEVEYSLRRLGTDYIDVYYTHSQAEPPVMTTIEETMSALMDLKREGKILAIGAANVSMWHLEEYVKWGELDIIQQKYSLLDRAIEAEIVPFCIKNNIAIQTYSVLEKGLLTGRYQRGTQVEKGNIREESPWFLPENIGKPLDLLDGWKDLCEKYDCHVGNLVIAWTKQQPGITNVLCGGRRPDHMKDNARGGDIMIDDADMARMNKDIAEKIVLA